MTTSGTTSFGMYRNDILRAALRKVGVREPTADEIWYASDSFDIILKSLDNEHGMPWKSTWYTQTFSALSNEVTGSDGNIYTCILSHTSSADNKPVTGKEWPIYWTLAGSTGGVWATSTAYTSAGDFSINSSVIAVEKVTLRRDSDDYDLMMMDRFDYGDVKNKDDFGIPSACWVDYSQSTPKMHLLDIPDSTDYVIRYLGITPIQDMTFGNNTGDFPQRWYRALVYLIADDIAVEFMSSEDLAVKGRVLSVRAQDYKRAATRGDTERTSEDFARPCY